MKQLWTALLLVLLLTGCARMGQPDGGWYDEDPPQILHETPADKATGINSKKITIFFDEFIKLDNPSEKVVVSPPQLEQAEIKAGGKRITVELQDSLKPNTTYTIDFSDAISDNNEGNLLGNYTYTFSTGDHIDTMEVAGYVLEAENLEPIKGILVGLYDDLSDTAFLHKPLLRVSRTDDNGHFTIKGVRDGRYRVYALQDMDGNYMFSQRSEKLAFSHDIVATSCKPDFRQDTIWRDTLHISDIKRVPYTHFLPDDVVLRAFNEILTDRYFLKAERREASRFTLFYSYGDSLLPQLKGLNFDETNAFIEEPSMNNDTITYWLRDTTLVNQDTLRMQMRYQMTDTLGHLQWQTDTLEVLSKDTYAHRQRLQQEAYNKWCKKQERNKKRGRPYEEVMAPEPMNFSCSLSGTIDPLQNPRFDFSTPLERIDTTKIHLYAKVDTTWYKSDFLFNQLPGKLRQYQMTKNGNWIPGTQYSLEIDSAAFTDIYGKVSSAFKQGFKVRSLDEYGSLQVTLLGMKDTTCVVQLLNMSGKIAMEETIRTGSVQFNYVKPEKYYLSLFIDSNGNGVWDTGEYAADRQPEMVYFYPKQIECKAKWDISETWNPVQLPLFKQKPATLVKQKGNSKKTIRSKNAERASKLGIPYSPKLIKQKER